MTNFLIGDCQNNREYSLRKYFFGFIGLVAYEERKNKSNFCGVSAAETMDICQQSKVKKSKVKESKDKEKESKEKESKVKDNKLSPTTNIVDGDENIFKFFGNNIGLITPFQSESLNNFIDDGMEESLILEVMKKSLGKRDKWSWISKVLNNCFTKNILTLEQFKSAEIEFENTKTAKQSGNVFLDILKEDGDYG